MGSGIFTAACAQSVRLAAKSRLVRQVVYFQAGMQQAPTALALSVGRDVQYGAGLALAFARDACRDQALAADLAKRFPEDTVVQFKLTADDSRPARAQPYLIGCRGIVRG